MFLCLRRFQKTIPTQQSLFEITLHEVRLADTTLSDWSWLPNVPVRVQSPNGNSPLPFQTFVSWKLKTSTAIATAGNATTCRHFQENPSLTQSQMLCFGGPCWLTGYSRVGVCNIRRVTICTGSAYWGPAYMALTVSSSLQWQYTLNVRIHIIWADAVTGKNI